MPFEMATVNYFLPEPFDSAVPLLWKNLEQSGLSIIEERDLSGWIEKALGVRMSRCTVLYVCSRQPYSEAVNTCVELGALLPMHIVISDHGRQTEIHLPSPLLFDRFDGDEQIATVLNRLHREISAAIKGIAMRRSGWSWNAPA